MVHRFLCHVISMTLQKIVPAFHWVWGTHPFKWIHYIFWRPVDAVRWLFVPPSPYINCAPDSSSLRLQTLELPHVKYPKKMELKGRVTVYSILGCPHCMRAKNSLNELGIPFYDVRVDVYPKEVRESLKARTGKSTVPQIFFNANYVGGNEDLQNLVNVNKSEYDKFLKDVLNNPVPANAPPLPDPASKLESDDPGDFTCEPDEYLTLVNELKKSGLIKDHWKGIVPLKRSFSGKSFVDWVVQTKGLDRNTAVELGQDLIDSHFGHHVTKSEVFKDEDNVYYRLLEDTSSAALNGTSVTDCEPRDATAVGEDVRKLILKLYSAFLTKDGKGVDYKGIANSAEFQKYVRLTHELQRINIADINRNEKLAFFINIYNALVIHGNIVRGPPVNLWQRYKFFNTVKYRIGGYDYSLQDIENGVLRGNRKGVGMLTKPFSKSDPRLPVALETPEPLIHFGLVCGAKSCPPIKTYTAKEVTEQLAVAAEAFFEGPDGLQIDVPAKKISLSSILKWYREDFGNNDQEVIVWVYRRMGKGEKKKQLKELLESGGFKIAHLKYDWSVNSK